ncbi:hypothetical protein KUH03_35725 [Sphingobacterium sp. E70]|uniref:hypothetical protein n=1 Tax=Sphingobacterium sp. E70 TaxID=2853439 RepID=UPI00211B7EDE|nr:hypothetical protein [Sphingobacterium sp. E70]ULT24317.1 hypothetical protein KUH03_35725 [Sphingobacterium sp. E70]
MQCFRTDKRQYSQKVQAIVADKFPAARVLNLSYEYNGGYKYSSNAKGLPVPKVGWNHSIRLVGV